MEQPRFVGVYISNNQTDKLSIVEKFISQRFQQVSGINSKLLFLDEATLDEYIDLEYRLEQKKISSPTNNTLQSMSSGQKKKALLLHLLGQSPEYLILDDLCSYIDSENREILTSIIKSYLGQATFIQLLYRKSDLSPLVEELFVWENGDLIKQDLEIFRDTEKTKHIFPTLPLLESIPTQDSSTLLKFNNVNVSYEDRPILHQINWEVKQGEFWQLKGPNGSGKTTLVGLITGDNPKAYGQDIEIMSFKKGMGETVWQIKKHIGYFTPDMLLRFSRMDNIENMIVSGFYDSVGLYIKPTATQLKVARDWIEVLGLKQMRKQPFYTLSQAHQRLAMIARAMVKPPKLLILDEPTSGLDDDNAYLFTQLVKNIWKHHVSIIYISHQEEPHLCPQYIYELIPSSLGAIGKIRT